MVTEGSETDELARHERGDGPWLAAEELLHWPPRGGGELRRGQGVEGQPERRALGWGVAPAEKGVG